ncbi:Hint domain-containing protein [Sinorhizobium americanum]|uniref:Hint domain-containing protein n=1 Tax=Sinorhizobium americanum TaxID=194963 RepID=UPI000933E0EB|nr:Hint domain-containing protein [Sinorhizobium americanum]
MPSRRERPHVDHARRHFLGLAAAAGAKIAAVGAVASTIFPSLAKPSGRAWWKDRHPGRGQAIGRGRDSGPSGGPGGQGNPMCLLRGTAIMTPKGEVCIEDLRIGDLVETVRGEALPIKWIGRHVFRRSGANWKEAAVPIRIARFALDEHTPHKELYVTRGHALFLDGILIRAQDLVNGTSISTGLPTKMDRVEYFHIMLATHEVILAEGAAVETSLLNGYNYEGFTNFTEFARLYPGDRGATMTPFAPIVGYGCREHLKALLRISSWHRIRMHSPLQDAYERIAARGEETNGLKLRNCDPAGLN